MKKAIYKYKINSVNKQANMPVNHDIMSVDFIDGDLFVWAYVNINDKELVAKTFDVVLTGEEFTPKGWFVGTAILNSSFVVHVFA